MTSRVAVTAGAGLKAEPKVSCIPAQNKACLLNKQTREVLLKGDGVPQHAWHHKVRYNALWQEVLRGAAMSVKMPPPPRRLPFGPVHLPAIINLSG